VPSPERTLRRPSSATPANRPDEARPRVAPALAIAFAAACGARSGLQADSNDAGRTPEDANTGEAGGAQDDAGAPRDAGTRDAVVPPPPIFPIYLVDETRALLSFDPRKDAFTRIGAIGCGVAARVLPSALAVDRAGNGYLLFQDAAGGRVYHLNMTTAACAATDASLASSTPVLKNGMAFVADGAESRETLYAFVAPDEESESFQLFAIVPDTFAISRVGANSGSVIQAMGTGTGSLFFSGAVSSMDRTSVFRVDIASAAYDAVNTYRFGPYLPLSAVALWHANLYFFAGPDSADTPDGSTMGTTVLLPRDGYLAAIAKWPVRIVLAAVQTTQTQ
jgi:hypothetical protein